MRPVARGYIRYESLIDGTVGLADVALLNDHIDAVAENETRMRAAYDEARRRGR